jgi:hypothetical protein
LIFITLFSYVLIDIKFFTLSAEKTVQICGLWNSRRKGAKNQQKNGCLLIGECCLPEVVTFAQYQVGLGEQRRPHFTQTAITTPALETVFVPVHVQCFQQVSANNQFAGLNNDSIQVY